MTNQKQTNKVAVFAGIVLAALASAVIAYLTGGTVTIHVDAPDHKDAVALPEDATSAALSDAASAVTP